MKDRKNADDIESWSDIDEDRQERPKANKDEDDSEDDDDDDWHGELSPIPDVFFAKMS